MRQEVEQALKHIDEEIERHAALTERITLIKSDREKYEKEAAEIEATDYKKITVKIIGKLSILKTRLQLIPLALERTETELRELDSEFPELIRHCSKQVEPIVAAFADAKAEQMKSALISAGTSQKEVEETLAESRYIRELRSLWFRGQAYRTLIGFKDGLSVFKQLRPIAEEALKDTPDFDRFKTV